MLIDYLRLEPATAALLKFRRPATFEPSPNDCHLNAWCQLRSLGGSLQHAWILAQDKRQGFCEAIFHTVWRSPDGQLVDVTPRANLEKRVLFIPDQQREITLTEYHERPAMVTYASVKMLGGHIVESIEQFTAVLQGGFAETQGLWHW